LYHTFSWDLLIKIVHNPGYIPDLRLLGNADITVVSDMPWMDYEDYQSMLFEFLHLPDTGVERQDLSYIINGVPSNWTYEQLDGFVGGMLHGAGWVFVTDSTLGSNATISQEWGSNWDSFAEIMWQNPPRT